MGTPAQTQSISSATLPLPHASQESRRSCKHLTVCVKRQHQVKCFMCFLKSQPCFFYTALNMNVYPSAPLFPAVHTQRIYSGNFSWFWFLSTVNNYTQLRSQANVNEARRHTLLIAAAAHHIIDLHATEILQTLSLKSKFPPLM